MNPKDRMGAAKPNLSVLPFAPLLEAIPALYEGRRKYGPWNWRAENVSESIYADAAIRHLMQFLAGEDVDPDSGVHHIAKAIAGLLVVRDAMLHGNSVDDRMVNQNLNIEGIMEQLAIVDEKYPEPVPSALPPRNETDIEAEVDEDADNHIFTAHDLGIEVRGDTGLLGEITQYDEDDNYLCVGVDFNDGSEQWYDCDGNRDHNVRDCSTPETISRVVPRSVGCEKWSDTVRGGGSYHIKKDDEGKRVGFRNGTFGTIDQVQPGDGTWVVDFIYEDEDGEDESDCCTLLGFSSSKCQDGDDTDAPEHDLDIVRVYHA
jgi:hypothetical protein